MYWSISDSQISSRSPQELLSLLRNTTRFSKSKCSVGSMYSRQFFYRIFIIISTGSTVQLTSLFVKVGILVLQMLHSYYAIWIILLFAAFYHVHRTRRRHVNRAREAALRRPWYTTTTQSYQNKVHDDHVPHITAATKNPDASANPVHSSTYGWPFSFGLM